MAEALHEVINLEMTATNKLETEDEEEKMIDKFDDCIWEQVINDEENAIDEGKVMYCSNLFPWWNQVMKMVILK